MEPTSARRAGLPPQRLGEDASSYRARLVRPTGDAARDALAHGWADHMQGHASWQRDWEKLADLCNPRQCQLTPPGEPVPLILSGDGARGFYLLGLAGLDGEELSRESLRDAVYFLSTTLPGRKIVQDLVPGYYAEADIPPGNLNWLRARDLWICAAPLPPQDAAAPAATVPDDLPAGAEEADADLDEIPAPQEAQEFAPEPQGLVGPCSVCGHLPGSWHKCCPVCSASADGEQDVERVFGFRTLRGRKSPQTWCRRCRNGQVPPPEQLALAV